VAVSDELHGSDLVLLLLAAPTNVASADGKINGITRLEKLLYLAERETDIADRIDEDRLQYVAYDYGPFSKDVYEAVEILEQSELLTESSSQDPNTIDSIEDFDVTGAKDEDDYVERRFQLTENGRLVAKLLSARHPEVVKALSTLKDIYADRSLSSLIRYVYRTYPESAANSKIREKYL
jgi:hypothetical protein